MRRWFPGVTGTSQDVGVAQFVGGWQEMLECIPLFVAAAVIGGNNPGEPILMIIGPNPPSQTDLLEMVNALNAFRLSLGFGQAGQQQSGQNGNNSDHHQQFDESKGSDCWTHEHGYGFNYGSKWTSGQACSARFCGFCN